MELAVPRCRLSSALAKRTPGPKLEPNGSVFSLNARPHSHSNTMNSFRLVAAKVDLVPLLARVAMVDGLLGVYPATA